MSYYCVEIFPIVVHRNGGGQADVSPNCFREFRGRRDSPNSVGYIDRLSCWLMVSYMCVATGHSRYWCLRPGLGPEELHRQGLGVVWGCISVNTWPFKHMSGYM